MPKLTKDTAIAYVAEMETRWQLAPSSHYLAIHRNTREEGELIRVQTDHNDWDVWQLDSGELYGEC